MCRGYYRAAFVWAVDFKDGKLSEVWLHQSDIPGQGIWGEGAHSLTIGDVDGDGKDEIIYGAGALDHDGTLLTAPTPTLTSQKVMAMLSIWPRCSPAARGSRCS